jgi:hypothetical protein
MKKAFLRRGTLALAMAGAAGGMVTAALHQQPAHAADANFTTIAGNTAGVVAATQAFMATLSASQLGSMQSSCTMSTGAGTLSYSYVVGLVTCWSNLPGTRNGLKIGDLSTAQQSALQNLIGTALSSRGSTYVSEIRAADAVINTVNANGGWGSDKYYVALYGAPSTSAPWMLQISGHHLALNLTYNGTYVSATPVFDGVEPPNWTDSAGVAHAPLENQRLAVYNLAQALQADAVTNTSAKLAGTYTDVVMGISGTTGCDSNFPISYPTGSTDRGAAYSSLSTAQKTLLKNALAAWTTLMPKVVSNTLLSAYTSDTALSETYVGFGVGDSGTASFVSSPSGLTSQHSYIRIDGPRAWIEFVVQQGVAYPTQVHYHTLWRDKVADYGGSFTTGSPATTGLCGASSGGGGGTPPGGNPGGPGGPGG